MGYPKANVSMNDVHGQPQFGGLLPADIWHTFMAAVVKSPCAQFAAPTTDPMAYLPFSGTYQRAGQAAYIPPSTGASGATGAGGASRGTGGAHAPTDHPTTNTPSTPPATNTPSTTTPATTTPATGPAQGGAQAPTGAT